jgi:hypothetical protein
MAGVPDLNEYLDRIIAGQQDDTIPPGVARAAAQREAEELFDKIDGLITDREAASKIREEQRKAAEAAAMADAQRQSELAEDLEMMNKVNRMLANSNGRLNRNQRIQLHNLIMQTISNTITNDEIKNELEANGAQAQTNIRDLFNALIQYYTEMASYGYERAPVILANIGSIVAGTAIIGGTILTPQEGTGGGMLMTLSRFIGPATATASGLYFLQRGGLPIQDMLESLGANTMRCVKAGCEALTEKMGKIYDAGLNSLKTHLNPDYSQFKIDWDASSGNFSVPPSIVPSDEASAASVAPSTASTTSTAAAAGKKITDILDVDDDVREEEVVTGLIAPANSLASSRQKLKIRRRPDFMDDEGEDVDYREVGKKRKYGDSQISDITDDSMFDNDSDYETGEEFGLNEKGGRKRKSRRNTKSRKSRKGRNVRKGRMTKKGRKHYKTLKRYRSKMRR